LLAGERIEKEVPADSVLSIELHLMDFRFDDCTSRKDGGVMRLRHEADGHGGDYPVYDSKVKCELVGYLTDSTNQTDSSDQLLLNETEVFDRREIEWIVGEAAAVDIPHGIEVAVRCMLQGEQSLFRVRKDYARRGSKATDPQQFDSIWPKNSDYVVYRIKLIESENSKEYFQLSAEERLSESKRID
jgi:hypothetical protein